MSNAWSDQIAVELIGGRPFRMYTSRPRNLVEVLGLARRWDDRPFVVQGTRALSFRQALLAIVDKARELDGLGVGSGDRVLILGWNGPEWIVNFWACQAVGSVPVLANAWWSATEVADALALTEPKLVLADVQGAKRLPAGTPLGTWGSEVASDQRGLGAGGNASGEIPEFARAIDESAAAVIIFTSGSSGHPKAVELSHRALLANLQMLLQLTHRLPHEVEDSAGEVILHTGPLFHVGGPQMLLRSAAVGNTIIMPAGRFDPAEVLELIERHRITRWAAVPTMVIRVLDQPALGSHDLSSLRALTIGGAPVHAELLKRVGEELPGVQAGVPTGYGLTENCGQATAASGRDTLKHPGSAGRPLPCVELRFLAHEDLPDPEVLVRSPTQMTRYLAVAESPIDSEGWLHTGDLGHLDEDGRLWLTGRAKDLIIRGGENIAPAAVEKALLSLPGVVDAAVVGVPHPDLGEEVCAFVVTDQALTPTSLMASLRAGIASFAIPTLWQVDDQPLPTNETGKVDKRSLRLRAAAMDVEQITASRA